MRMISNFQIKLLWASRKKATLSESRDSRVPTRANTHLNSTHGLFTYLTLIWLVYLGAYLWAAKNLF